jgi:hypothetical protein
MGVTKKELKLWEESNRLNDSTLAYVKTLAKQKKLKLIETVHHGYDAILLTSGLEVYKIVVNTNEFKLNVLGKNMVGNDKDHFHHIKDFFYKEDSWLEAIQFVGEIVQKKRSEYLCLGKRFYRKAREYG